MSLLPAFDLFYFKRCFVLRLYLIKLQNRINAFLLKMTIWKGNAIVFGLFHLVLLDSTDIVIHRTRI